MDKIFLTAKSRLCLLWGTWDLDYALREEYPPIRKYRCAICQGKVRMVGEIQPLEPYAHKIPYQEEIMGNY